MRAPVDLGLCGEEASRGLRVVREGVDRALGREVARVAPSRLPDAPLVVREHGDSVTQVEAGLEACVLALHGARSVHEGDRRMRARSRRQRQGAGEQHVPAPKTHVDLRKREPGRPKRHPARRLPGQTRRVEANASRHGLAHAQPGPKVVDTRRARIEPAQLALLELVHAPRADARTDSQVAAVLEPVQAESPPLARPAAPEAERAAGRALLHRPDDPAGAQPPVKHDGSGAAGKPKSQPTPGSLHRHGRLRSVARTERDDRVVAAYLDRQRHRIRRGRQQERPDPRAGGSGGARPGEEERRKGAKQGEALHGNRTARSRIGSRPAK